MLHIINLSKFVYMCATDIRYVYTYLIYNWKRIILRKVVFHNGMIPCRRPSSASSERTNIHFMRYRTSNLTLRPIGPGIARPDDC